MTFPKGQMQRVATMAGVVLALLAAVLVTLHFTLSDDYASRAGSLAGIVQSVVTVLAIMSGGAFAAYKWQVFRDFAPHLTISHRVSHRPIGDSYVHIDVTATLHNSSKVRIELHEGFFRLQQIAPVSDEEIEALYAQVFVDREHDYLRWPTGDEVVRTWDKDELIVEPGEAHQETFEFIVSREVRTAMVYTYFYNPRASQTLGWGTATVHDITGHDIIGVG